MHARVYAGTVGWGVWHSDDLGETWKQTWSEGELYPESRVWALSSHPERPGLVWAGTDQGIFRLDEAQRRWAHVRSPADGRCVWALAQSPRRADVIVAGTNPAGLFQSDDGGGSWRELGAKFAASCPFIGRPRVTRIRFDPLDARTLWASAEIDAVHRSRDGGASFERMGEGFRFPDIHDVVPLVERGRRKLLAATAVGLYASHDDGATWEWRKLDSPWQYMRAVEPRADGSGVVFLCNGDGPPGSCGRLLRSRDFGESFEDALLPGPLNSTPWHVATHASDPDLLFACTNLGQLFRSRDGGERWERLPRELGEVRMLHWHPGAGA
jgi:photosystem II stability/assembly factor-like uncharacterized protein